ncbi:MAG TPA: DoxX family protein [Lacunisphaera sp.]|nr:DoxX family protein [Lacunisphaera sp.]
MDATNPPASPSKAARIAGWILTVLPVPLLLMSGVMKLGNDPKIVEGFAKWPAGSATIIGILEISCTLIYLIPRTSVLGAILLTGYLGGATAISMQMGMGFMSLLPVTFGVLAWGGLFLRDPRIRALIPLRS